MQKLILFLVIAYTLVGCASTTAYLPKPTILKGAKIGIANFNLDLKKTKKTAYTDTLCFCVAKSVGETLTPYLQKMGSSVICLLADNPITIQQAYQAADSLKLDYLLFGIGELEITGNTTFAKRMSLKLVHLNTREIVLTGSTAGGIYTAENAAKKIGEKILKYKN
jgi:hypothetical protein